MRTRMDFIFGKRRISKYFFSLALNNDKANLYENKYKAFDTRNRDSVHCSELFYLGGAFLRVFLFVFKFIVHLATL